MDDLTLLVTFWGTRGSISTPGRTTEKYGGNTPCITVRCGKTLIVFDAGTGIRNLGLALVEEIKAGHIAMPIHLFLSHTHWDHIQGLPFFQPAYMAGVEMAIYGSPHKGGFLESILRGQMDYDYFPVDMSAFQSKLTINEMREPRLTVGPMQIDWEEQYFHPGGCVRYRVSAGGRSMVYATDVELNKFFDLPGANAEAQDHQQRFISFIRGTDLLVGDGQYTDEEYPKVVGWGHTTIPLLTRVAHESGVRQLAVFHHDPQHSDKMLDDLWQQYYPRYHAAKPQMNVFWAREGMTVPVNH